MADSKITDLTALPGASVDMANDVLLIADVSAATTKKITGAQLFAALLPGGTPLGTVTHTAGALTSGKVVIGAGTDDEKVSKVTLTDPATTATLTLADNSTLQTVGAYTVQLIAPGSYNYTLPSATSTLAALGVAQGWTAAQTFNNSTIVILGSSTGKTTLTSANSSATDYVITLPAASGTLMTTGSGVTTGKAIAMSIVFGG